MAAEPLQASDEHAQPGGVEEVDALEVDDDSVLALADELDEPDVRDEPDVDEVDVFEVVSPTRRRLARAGSR